VFSPSKEASPDLRRRRHSLAVAVLSVKVALVTAVSISCWFSLATDARAQAEGPAAAPSTKVDVAGSLTLGRGDGKPKTTTDLSGSVTISSSAASDKKDPPSAPVTGSCVLPDKHIPEHVLLIMYATPYATDNDAENKQNSLVPTQCEQGTPRLLSPIVCRPNYMDNTEDQVTWLPNKAMAVVVIHEETDLKKLQYASSVTASPAASETPPEVVPASLAASAAKAARVEHAPGEATPPPSQCVVDTYTLAPRAPGAFTVTSQLTDSSGKPVFGTSRQVEFLVKHQYIGAVRVGAAMSFPLTSGVSSWSTQQTANGTSVIYENGHSPGVFEVVAGYSAFLDGPITAASLAKLHPGLYTGLGIISTAPSTGNLTYFTSAYFGLDLSWRGFALELLAGVRRNTVLADGFSPGSLLPTGAAVPTKTEFVFAPAVALSLSSDIFKVAGMTVP
jgi:hypothetical protein